jgi:hypothetical protein
VWWGKRVLVSNIERLIDDCAVRIEKSSDTQAESQRHARPIGPLEEDIQRTIAASGDVTDRPCTCNRGSHGILPPW